MGLTTKMLARRLYDQNSAINFCLFQLMRAGADLHRLKHLKRGQIFLLLLFIETLGYSLLPRVIVIFHDWILKITFISHINAIAILQVLFSSLRFLRR